jgi:polyhydroxybutyrate depolymerase
MTRWPTLLLLALLPACRHPIAGVGSPGETTVVLPDAASDDRAPRTDDLTLAIGGHDRHLIVHLPGGDPAIFRPLVFNLHGSGGTAAGQQAYTAMDVFADAHDFVVAYPDGGVALGGGFAWNVPGQPRSGGGEVPADAADDVAFFREAITVLRQRYPIDGRRIFATGFSGGARMASQLGCDLATVIAAIAPVAGLRFPGPCDRPLPVISFHGTADATNPYEGGGPPYWTYSVPSAAAQWAAHDGCGASPEVSAIADGVELSAYRGCASSRAEVDLYTIAGAGHEWPGAPGQALTVDASALMWDFFAAHGMSSSE